MSAPKFQGVRSLSFKNKLKEMELYSNLGLNQFEILCGDSKYDLVMKIK